LWSCVAGTKKFKLLPLHSQIPREEQRLVFQPVPEGVTKVSNAMATWSSCLNANHEM
jgi:hypothetical protein